VTSVLDAHAPNKDQSDDSKNSLYQKVEQVFN
jgi:hypothetical protein